MTTPIFSDNPEAVDLLRAKLADLESDQVLWKAVNKLVKKNDRAGLKALGLSDAQIEEYFKPDFAGRIGIPAYQLTNNNANIRRLKERIEEVSKKQALQDYDETVDDVKIEYAPSENRIRIFYPGRVDLDTFKLLKRYGFRVLRSAGEGAFSGYHNGNCQYFIKQYIKKTG